MVAAISYAVPNGVDAAVLSSALAGAGFPNSLELVGSEEYLRIECQPGERERVRSVIAGTNERAYAASGLTIGAVMFADER